jgi:hypothetical protein
MYSDLRDKPATIPLNIELAWHLELNWAGPDSDTSQFGANQIARPNQSYSPPPYSGAPTTQQVEFHFAPEGGFANENGAPLAIAADGVVPNAFVSPPVRLTFPTAGRRLPVVILGQNRPWGRQQNATQKESIVIEWQPGIVTANNNAEMIRGGNGVAVADSMKIYNQRLYRWSAPEIVEPFADPDLRTPHFRVRSRTDAARGIPGGDRIPVADAETLIREVVALYFNDPAHINQPHVALLSLQCWQTTARLIFTVENRGLAGPNQRQYYRQYLESNSGRFHYESPFHAHFFFGHQSGMPLFGAPHGYGFGQLDDPAAPEDCVWSFVANIRESVRRIFEIYGANAYAYLTTGIYFQNQAGTLLITARTTVNRAAYPPGPQGDAQFNVARNTALANAPTAGQDFLNLAPAQLRRQRAIYQRELVRRYNGGREFTYENAGQPPQLQWVVHTNASVANRSYPNDVLFNGNQVVAEPGPTAFDQAAQYGPDT